MAPAAGTSVYSSRVGVYPVGYRTIQLIWLIAAVVDLILALDFIFRAANANNTGFAHYIYRLGGWLAAPFNGIFNNTSTNGTVLRWGDVLAIVIYTVAAWIITKLVRISATPRYRRQPGLSSAPLPEARPSHGRAFSILAAGLTGGAGSGPQSPTYQ